MTNTPKLAIAIGYIDDDLVTGAVEYMPAPSKKFTHLWKHFVAVAACLCVVITGSMFFHQQHNQPEDMTDLHEIIQGGSNTSIIQESGFEVFDCIKIEESQLVKKFNAAAMMPTYSVVNTSVFDIETINRFAENAANAGWFTNYTVEYNDGVYSIINKEATSTPVNVSNTGGKEIADQFMNDAGVTNWLNTQNITVKYGERIFDIVPAKYYHLMIDGQYFADNIQLVMDNGIVLECNFAIREYEKSAEMLPVMSFADALSSTFCIPDNSTISTLKVYGSEFCYVAGLPMYVLSGDTEDGTSQKAFAAAFEIDNPEYATQLYEALN